MPQDSDKDRVKLKDDDVRVVLCAVLLHDMGHGPFSHSFESVLANAGLFDGKAPSHEQWGAQIIEQVFTERLSGLVHAGLFKALTHANDAVDMPPCPRYLRDIISSQLDVDRMDYLVRDAYFSGVSLGQIDIQYLIRSLAVVEKGPE
jgi:HD superfamily phosphohydrolase